jgi:hypothetical protein
MNDIFRDISLYRLKQLSWCESYNEIDNKNIEDTLEFLKSHATDLSIDILYYAIRHFAHIEHIKYILSVIGDISPDICHEIQDIIQWNYICCSYNIELLHGGEPVLYNHYLWLLDEYAKLCGVTYCKSCRLEKMAVNFDREPTWKLYVLLELDSIGYTLVPQIRECIARGAVLDKASFSKKGVCHYYDIPLWRAIDCQCSANVFKVLFEAHYDANDYNQIQCGIPMGDDGDYEDRLMTLKGYIRYMMGINVYSLHRSIYYLKQYWRIISPNTRPKPKKDRSTCWYL